ncbi:hypothetical protein OG407_25575 [Streptomyces sp. NBC_01515]|uniref:hypothetical protein n=1 Tax=Streptomyces sp. NBC_01515 TaxID=2903890 RepID=UPI003864A50A
MSAVAGRRRVPVWLGVGVVVLAVVGGGGTWLLRDELFHPFGDARACDGSDLRLPGAITAGGATIPADATDVHYYTRNGGAQVTFTSWRTKDYLNRAGILPGGKALFDPKYGTKFEDGDPEIALPDGLCGKSLRAPARQYHSTAANGTRVDVTVEVSTLYDDAFRVPARVVVGCTTP